MIPGSFATAEATRAVTSENKLISAAQLGDQDAFGVLFEQYKDVIYGFVLKTIDSKDDAEDIVQETFCRAWNSIGRFRGDSKLLTWLCRIATNLCMDYMRSPRRKVPTATELDLDTENTCCFSLQSESAEDGSITKHLIKDALEKLPPSHKMLVILCDVQGFTCEEASRVLKCSSISARVRLSRARKTLRKLLSPALEGVE
ncbi:MAG TPA: RNA polymerase sigma factor [Armatimonadota bacterium]|nr:RNA polymerase sigma factor [Armatimonadota bacterium]